MGHAGDVAALLGRSQTLIALSDLHTLLASAAKDRASSATQPRRHAPQASPAGTSKEAPGQPEHAGSTGSRTTQAAASTPSDTAKQQLHSQGERSSSAAAQEPSRNLPLATAQSTERRPQAQRLAEGQRSGGPGKTGRAAAKDTSRILLHAERKAWFMLVGALICRQVCTCWSAGMK